MKAMTFAALLAASAGAGAAAAGGPFFFAVTTPVAFFESNYTTNPTTNRARLTYPISTQHMVITDISTTANQLDEFTFKVDDTPVWVWALQSGGYTSPRDGRIHLEHGIPVPAGSVVTIEKLGTIGSSPPYSIAGYCYD